MKKFMFLTAVFGLLLVFPNIVDAGCRPSYNSCGGSYYQYQHCQPQYYYHCQPQVQHCQPQMQHQHAPQGGCPNGQCPPQTAIVKKPIPIAQPNQEQATPAKPEMAPCPAPLFVEF